MPRSCRQDKSLSHPPHTALQALLRLQRFQHRRPNSSHGAPGAAAAHGSHAHSALAVVHRMRECIEHGGPVRVQQRVREAHGRQQALCGGRARGGRWRMPDLAQQRGDQRAQLVLQQRLACSRYTTLAMDELHSATEPHNCRAHAGPFPCRMLQSHPESIGGEPCTL